MLLKPTTFLKIAAKSPPPAAQQVHFGVPSPVTSHLALAVSTLSRVYRAGDMNFCGNYLPFNGVARLSAVWARVMSLAVMPPASCVTSATFTLL
jgi:hypothetical protein